VAGDHVWIGEGVWIDNLVKIEIGSNVCISQAALLLTGNHDYGDPAFRLLLGEIFLEDGVWLGAKAVVCPGVRCARNSVITAGSVIREDAEANGVYVGNPATLARRRVIRS
jgi:putative colanic acid biosynthesis acetyltransferase WcaF